MNGLQRELAIIRIAFDHGFGLSLIKTKDQLINTCNHYNFSNAYLTLAVNARGKIDFQLRLDNLIRAALKETNKNEN